MDEVEEDTEYKPEGTLDGLHGMMEMERDEEDPKEVERVQAA